MKPEKEGRDTLFFCYDWGIIDEFLQKIKKYYEIKKYFLEKVRTLYFINDFLEETEGVVPKRMTARMITDTRKILKESFYFLDFLEFV